MTISNRQRVFIEEYLTCWNASEAARRAGYAHERVAGTRLLANVAIREEVDRRIDEKAMTADEVLTRLADIARGDLGDFLDIGPMGFIVDLNDAQEAGKTRLLKRAKMRTVTTLSKDGVETETHDMEIELYSALDALAQLGRHHKLFTDNTDVTSGGEKIQGNNEKGYDRALSTLADAIGEALSGASRKPGSQLDAAKQAPVGGSSVEGG